MWTGNGPEGGTVYVCSGTTTGMSGLTDSPSDEKFDTLLATPFLSCFLQKRKKNFCHEKTLGSLTNDYGDNNNSARSSRFFVHFLAAAARLQRETS